MAAGRVLLVLGFVCLAVVSAEYKQESIPSSKAETPEEFSKDVPSSKNNYYDVEPRIFKKSIFTALEVVSFTSLVYTKCLHATLGDGLCNGKRRRRSLAGINLPDSSSDTSLDTSVSHSLTLGSGTGSVVPAPAEGRGNPFILWASQTSTFTSIITSSVDGTTLSLSAWCSFNSGQPTLAGDYANCP